MLACIAVVLCVTVSTCAGVSFPPGFRFGVASSAYQVEGAWNVSDKGESIWDRLMHSNPAAASDGRDGDVASDSYHMLERDVEMMEELGVHYYRFSLSWTRLLPSGFSNHVSEDGTRYYNALVDALLEKGIEPLVTLYHWDLPQSLQDLGGWTNPLVSDWFADYARTAFSIFGDRVKTWITLNEPMVFCDIAYNTGIMAPAIVDDEVAPYLCNKHALMAHAKAWRIYDEEFRAEQKGRLSLSNHLVWMEPESPADEELAELARENMAGRYSHAIYSKSGGWPPAIERRLAANSLKQGYPRPNLPAFTDEEREFVKGTYDFYGLNFYTSRLIRPAREDDTLYPWPLGDAPDLDAKLLRDPSWGTCQSFWLYDETLYPWPLGDAPDLDAKLLRDPSWGTCQSFWLYIHPEGIRKQLAWLKKTYGDIEILITENGYPNTGGLDDFDRIDFQQKYLKQVLLAITEDRVNVSGYTAWTLLDNFEWMDGYTSKFGLYEVDFDSPERSRIARASAHYYSSVIKAHSLEVDPNYRLPPRN